MEGKMNAMAVFVMLLTCLSVMFTITVIAAVIVPMLLKGALRLFRLIPAEFFTLVVSWACIAASGCFAIEAFVAPSRYMRVAAVLLCLIMAVLAIATVSVGRSLVGLPRATSRWSK